MVEKRREISKRFLAAEPGNWIVPAKLKEEIRRVSSRRFAALRPRILARPSTSCSTDIGVAFVRRGTGTRLKKIDRDPVNNDGTWNDVSPRYWLTLLGKKREIAWSKLRDDWDVWNLSLWRSSHFTSISKLLIFFHNSRLTWNKRNIFIIL